jgi:hypothetical protein
VPWGGAQISQEVYFFCNEIWTAPVTPNKAFGQTVAMRTSKPLMDVDDEGMAFFGYLI